jgi:hypothetical protein
VHFNAYIFRAIQNVVSVDRTKDKKIICTIT